MRPLAAALELKVPPFALAGLGALLMWGVAARWPGLDVRLPARDGIAVVLWVVGAAIGLAGVGSFRANRTTVNPMRPAGATRLVRAGVYRYTRNPMYLGLVLALAGWAAWLSNAGAAAVLPAFAAYLSRFQIVPEERALAERFGPDFTAYATRVRRWAGRKRPARVEEGRRA